MPYIDKTIEGNEAVRKMLEEDGFLKLYGIETPEEARTDGVKLEIVCSSFSDPGEDWNRYDVKDKDDKVIWSYEFPGY